MTLRAAVVDCGAGNPHSGVAVARTGPASAHTATAPAGPAMVGVGQP